MNGAVGFDFDHTLGLDNGLERHAFGQLAVELGTPIDVDEPQEHAFIEGLLAAFRAVEIPMNVMLARFVARRLPPAAALQTDAAALADRYRTICYGLVDALVRPMDGALDCIAALVATATPVGILTNGWSPLQERKIARALGTFPGPVLVSELLGTYKPSADAFRRLEAALGCGAAGLWYVGDNPLADIDGARAYGLRAVWFNRAGAPYPAGLEPPTAEIADLSVLPPIVRGD